MDPQEILDRNETCQRLGISRQTLLSWIRKGKLRVWKRVGSGSNSALLFTRIDVESLCKPVAASNGNGQAAAEPTAA